MISPRCRVPRRGSLTRVVLASCSKGFGSPGCVPHRLGALPLFPFALGWLLACWFLSVGNSASASDLPLRKRGRGKVAMVCWECDVGLGLAPSGPPSRSRPVGMSVVVVPFPCSAAPLCPVWLVRCGWFHSIVAPLWPRAGLPAWLWAGCPCSRRSSWALDGWRCSFTVFVSGTGAEPLPPYYVGVSDARNLSRSTFGFALVLIMCVLWPSVS